MRFVLDTKPWQGKLLHNEPMAAHTSWRVGGVAKQFYQPENLVDVCRFLQSLSAHEPVLWIGLGSNLLVRDGGFPGTVILSTPALKAMRLTEDGNIYAQAGVPCAKLARFAAQHDLTGGEFFAGIPGTVGGALAMNAGAFGGETWAVVESVQTVDRRGQLTNRQPTDFTIGYRSVGGPQQEWFAAGVFTLQAGDAEQSRAAIRALLTKRGQSQPTQFANAGSVFRNPEGDHAARLIEQCGLKGKTIGGAQVSEKHANFIINTGSATAADIENLIAWVAEQVQKKFSMRLQPEVRIVGEHAVGS